MGKIAMKPEDEARYAAMEKKFARIDDQNKKTAEIRALKEKMLREQAEFVPPAMPGSYIGAKPSQAYKPKPNPYSSLAKAGSRPVKMTQEQMIEAERLLEKEKNRERK